MWSIEIRHEGLNKYRHIKGSDKNAVEQKAVMQQRIWDDMWEAITKTDECNNNFLQLENILSHTLKINDAIDWESLFNNTSFNEPSPSKPKLLKPSLKPETSDSKYLPKFSLFDKLSSKSKQNKIDLVNQSYQFNLKVWMSDLNEINSKNKQLEEKYQENLNNWELKKAKFREVKDNGNLQILKKQQQYQNSDPEAIYEYCDMVLSNSIYPDYFPQQWNLEYQENSRILIVDYSLPDIESIPKIKSVKYIATTDSFSEAQISSSALTKIYDDVLYQISLRTIHELFEADVINAIDTIVFNGWVDSIDKSTGHNFNACIMSISTGKDEFIAINLKNVEPKACFKQLKGVGSSKLHGLSPITPILTINKEDKRFVASYDVIGKLDDTINLAAMDWQDFENLIREIFEKEFSTNGGEVKITQASRDGGVDAVAFDPDPIRGGKIVVQAKRYTNVVGVSAVRDLYGTTMNEGATKGILVTTANFGPDAYDFAKGKPLTLLNGGNLLHLLEKHGHKAKIDLKEAKALLMAEK